MTDKPIKDRDNAPAEEADNATSADVPMADGASDAKDAAAEKPKKRRRQRKRKQASQSAPQLAPQSSDTAIAAASAEDDDFAVMETPAADADQPASDDDILSGATDDEPIVDETTVDEVDDLDDLMADTTPLPDVIEEDTIPEASPAPPADTVDDLDSFLNEPLGAAGGAKSASFEAMDTDEPLTVGLGDRGFGDEFVDDDLTADDESGFGESNFSESGRAQKTAPLGTGGMATTELAEDEKELPEIMLARDESGVIPGLEDDEKDATTQHLPAHERFYRRVLNVLRLSEDLDVDSLAAARINELLREDRLPQLAIRDLLTERLVDRIQLARAIARSQGRLEILTVQDLPEGARHLRKELETRAQVLLRERRVIPLRKRVTETGGNELHLAHPSSMRDLVLEAALAEIMPGYEFIWHYATQDVCGQYWLSGDEGADLDEGMEAEALLDRIITTAVDSKASDIHIDPHMRGENKATIKYRVDGMVRPKEVVNLEQLDRLRVRIENIARMPKVNQNHPNKGAFSRAGFDWRVQIQPHAGRTGAISRIVIRRLNPDSMALEKLGYPEYFIRKIKAASKASNGVVLWTGPTGSGKTESIHSAVISVDPMARGLSVHTIEDPPEKRVEGYAVQMEVAEGDPARSGLELLKSSLRADPDVIIFGEVRDPEMAKLVFEAANTGHLVFSTLHTNSSIDAIVRLDELNIRGFLVSYVRGVAAQRLVRRLCTHCRKPMTTPDDWTKFCFNYYDMSLEGAKLFKANKDGCPNCNFTGYRGRVAVAEWLVPDKAVIDATARREFEDLERLARNAGWEPMGKMGVYHVKQGITDCEELARVILELSVEMREDDDAGADEI